MELFNYLGLSPFKVTDLPMDVPYFRPLLHRRQKGFLRIYQDKFRPAATLKLF